MTKPETQNAQQNQTVSPEAKKIKPKKIIGIVFTSLGIAVVAFLFVVAATLAVDKFVRKSPVPAFCGYSTLIVTTGSMQGTIDEGDMIIIKRTDTYKVGDVVSFIQDGSVVTHRIIREEDGNFFTKGDANNVEDTRAIKQEHIVGKVTGKIPHLGLFFSWIKDEGGWAYIVAAAAVVVCGVILLKYVSLDGKKKEKDKGNE